MLATLTVGMECSSLGFPKQEKVTNRGSQTWDKGLTSRIAWMAWELLSGWVAEFSQASPKVHTAK
jgi:hypothetical protein